MEGGKKGEGTLEAKMKRAREIESTLPSLLTTYRPKNPVHPKTVAV